MNEPQKSGRLEGCNFQTAKGRGLRTPQTIAKTLYQSSRENASPNLARKGGVPRMGWSMIFTTIGVACAAKWFMDLLDKLEGEVSD